MTDTATEGLWHDGQRRRLVRLCAVLTGDRDAAEDLAQETLLEAWRNAHKLDDLSGAERWVAAIARNVCLRWVRRRGRDLPTTTYEAAGEVADDLDLERELERTELAELLDRALAALPRETRDVLVHRYVDDLAHADIGARLGVSEDAVSMRLSRGKVVLRGILARELGESGDEWRQTKVWCSQCGERRLVVRRDEHSVAFRCPGCTPDSIATEYRLSNPLFARLVGEVVRPSAILARAADWSRRYYEDGTDAAHTCCTSCGRAVRLRHYVRDGRRGLHATCAACGEQVSSSLAGLAGAQPEVRRWRREHPRVRALPERELGGNVVVRYQSVRGRDGVDVLFARDSLRVVAVQI